MKHKCVHQTRKKKKKKYSGRRQPMLASDATLSRRANATFSDAQTHSHSDSSSARCPFFFGRCCGSCCFSLRTVSVLVKGESICFKP